MKRSQENRGKHNLPCLCCCCQLKCASMAESLIICVRLSVTGLRFSLSILCSLLFSSPLLFSLSYFRSFAHFLAPQAAALSLAQLELAALNCALRTANCQLRARTSFYLKLFETHRLKPLPPPLPQLLLKLELALTHTHTQLAQRHAHFAPNPNSVANRRNRTTRRIFFSL